MVVEMHKNAMYIQSIFRKENKLLRILHVIYADQKQFEIKTYRNCGIHCVQIECN